MMKKILLAAGLLMITTTCPAETKQALTLCMESGASIVYYLDSQPSIGFRGQTMVVTVANETSDIPMQEVNHWEIGLAEVSGIDTATDATEAGHVRISVYGNNLTILNPNAQGITIYNLNGQMVGASNDTDASFTLCQGIYVIKIGNNTYKIAIR